MEIDQLRTFLAVLERGSFSRAAEALKIGQSTVSFHVKALEAQVGARLCDRGGGRVKPTAAGRVLERYARRLVALRDEALARLRDEERGEAGRLAIAASTIPAEYLLPPLLAELRRARPQLAVSLSVSSSRRAIAALLAEECDLAVVGARLPERRLLYLPLVEDEVVLVGRAGEGPRRLSADELRRAPLILREEGSGTRRAIEPLAHDRAPAIEVGSTEAAKRCVLAGLGLALLSRRAVADELHAGRMQVVSAPGLPVKRRFYAARLRAATPAPPARALWQLLQKNR